VQFRLAADQDAVLASVSTLLDRYAGADRMRELGGHAPAYDGVLDAALADAGFTRIALEPDGGALEAALVTEAVAARLGVVPFGAEALVAVGATGAMLPGPMALTTAAHRGPVRYAVDGGSALVATEDEVLVHSVPAGACEPVQSRFGYPMARLGPLGAEGAVARLGPGSADRVRAWWRVALAVEIVGTMRTALSRTVEYVAGRRQFGVAIGSFQAIQHRLSDLTVAVEGARWLALEAAWAGAPIEAAAAALTHAVAAAKRVTLDAHQLTGALGFSTEYDLHLWTMRLPALVVEAGWMGAPEADLVAARWFPDAR
jgi:alkylation response protein AidB-like acyl-CoA dehydrogenase